MTPYYQRDGITIFCGECSKVLSGFDPQSFDLTVTSPPYDDLREYNGYTFDFEPIAAQLWRVTKVGGVVVWVVGDQTKNGSESGTSFRQALGFMELGFRLETMIYQKRGFAAGSMVHYLQAFEYMFLLCKGQPKTTNHIRDRENIYAGQKRGHGGRRAVSGKRRIEKAHTSEKYGKRYNIWDYHVTGNGTNHPAIFPEALARDHIISWSNPGDLVLDPMMGSGTTLKMAQQLGRRCVGIDVSEEYCKIAVERLRQPTFWSVPTETTTEQKAKQPTLL